MNFFSVLVIIFFISCNNSNEVEKDFKSAKNRFVGDWKSFNNTEHNFTELLFTDSLGYTEKIFSRSSKVLLAKIEGIYSFDSDSVYYTASDNGEKKSDYYFFKGDTLILNSIFKCVKK
jgi:hypothetical protein